MHPMDVVVFGHTKWKYAALLKIFKRANPTMEGKFVCLLNECVNECLTSNVLITKVRSLR